MWAIELFPNVATVLWPSGNAECINGVCGIVWASEQANERMSEWACVCLPQVNVFQSKCVDCLEPVERPYRYYRVYTKWIHTKTTTSGRFIFLSRLIYFGHSVRCFRPDELREKEKENVSVKRTEQKGRKSAMINKDAMHLHEHIVG